ncbi:GGDEF domain-containing protein [Thalassobaculum sp.]|uniref:GGDEF domain-containing protein n=1 Tax=Thalassobaculum sp. TaxID=2022740 RepID=UPI0032EB22B1
MIDTLDVRTLAVVTAAVFTSVSAILILVYFTRQVYAGFGHWVLWQLCLIAGALVFAVRGSDPSALAVILTNALLLTSSALLFSGVARFHSLYPGRAPDLANYALVAVAVAAQGYFAGVEPDLDSRVVIYSLTQAVLLARCALEPLRVPAIRRSLSFLVLSAVLLVLVANNLHHAWLSAQPGPVMALESNPKIRLALLLVIVFDVVGTYSLLMQTGERLEAELRKARQDIETLARTDSLTGLWNRRHFEDMIEVEIARSQRDGLPLSLLAIDADHFKRVNDRFGHHTGDAVLRELTDLLGRHVRERDILCRWGGEEFIILMPATDRNEAAMLARTIRNAVAGHGFTAIKTMTVSIGVGRILADETAEDWLRRVDAALYDAKQSGRDRVSISEPQERIAS